MTGGSQLAVSSSPSREQVHLTVSSNVKQPRRERITLEVMGYSACGSLMRCVPFGSARTLRTTTPSRPAVDMHCP